MTVCINGSSYTKKFEEIDLNLIAPVRHENCAIHRIVTFSIGSVTGKTHIKLQHFRLKVSFFLISSELTIPGVIAIHALLWYLKKSLSSG